MSGSAVIQCLDTLKGVQCSRPMAHGGPHRYAAGIYYESTPTENYEEIGRAIGKLVTEKQAAYGDSFGKSGEVMRILYPDGIPLAKMDDALTVVRVLDKLFRIATDRDALGESPWKDIAGYGLLGAVRAGKAKP